MPCTDGRTDTDRYREESEELKDRLDFVTELLCFVMSEFDSSSWYNTLSFGTAIDLERRRLEANLITWWEEHKKEDRLKELRQKREKAQEEKNRHLRQKLEVTFTPEEIAVLKQLI